MPTISLCMIVKNEEDVLERCLESAREFVDEIIIVDTGSTDKTKEIANNYTSKVYDFEWVDDFSAARNYSFSKATMDYILWLDADDIILEEDCAKFKQLKESLDPDVDVVMMKYNVGFDSKGNVNFSYFRERLCKRSKNYKWYDSIHEYLSFGGKVINSDICITHKKLHDAAPDRNIKIFQKMIAEGKTFSARNLFYFARELSGIGIHDDAIKCFQKFLDMNEGWVEDNINACYELSKCYLALKDEKNRLKALLRSFEYDSPRAEICCEIGYCFKDKKEYEKAAIWFDMATRMKKPKDSWGFFIHDCWDYIPLLELCVCNDKLGNYGEAIKYNEMAGAVKPDDPSVIYNRKYFSELLEGFKE